MGKRNRRAAPASGRAVVTGGANGLGAAIAERLVARGHAVVVADVDLAAAEATAERIGAIARRLDVADLEACRALAGETTDLTVWCNNAGILATGPSWETDEARRRRLFDVNVHGVINGTTVALEQMRPRGRGHVLNIASVAGITPSPNLTIYGATKHAVLGFSVGTQMDLLIRGERGIRISTVCPDGMWTPMLHEVAEDAEAWPSWQGVMLQPGHVAGIATGLLDRPHMVRAIPRWRGAELRIFAALPGLGARVLPLVVASSKRKQRRWAAEHTGR